MLINPVIVVKAIQSKVESLRDGNKWQASHLINDAATSQRPTVNYFDCGFSDGQVWFRFKFTEDGAEKDMKGTYSLHNVNELITINGEDVEADNVAVSNRFCGAKLRGVIEFEFQKNGETHRYRFDATLCSVI